MSSTKYDTLALMEEHLEMIERHVRIMQLISKAGPIGMMIVGRQLNIPQYQVRYAMNMLTRQGFIECETQVGREITEDGENFLNFALPKACEGWKARIARLERVGPTLRTTTPSPATKTVSDFHPSHVRAAI